MKTDSRKKIVMRGPNYKKSYDDYNIVIHHNFVIWLELWRPMMIIRSS